MTEQAFEQQILAMTQELYRVAACLLRRPQDRQDAVQECIWKAWRSLHRLRREEQFRPWVMRILVNQCRSMGRRARFEISGEPPERPAAEDPYESRLRDQTLRDAVLRLPEHLRLTVTLFYMDGFPLRETARILGVPAGTVKSRLNHARALLREDLEKEN